MTLTGKEKDLLVSTIEMFRGGAVGLNLTQEQIDVAKKVTFGDLVVEFGLDANFVRKFENHVKICSSKNARPGFTVNKLSESRRRRIILEEVQSMMIDLDKLSGDRISSFETGYEFGQEDSHQGYHPKKRGSGLSFEDSDPHEEAGMIKSNLFSIAKKAQSLHDMVGDADDLPEWVQEKIAVADEMIDVIKDYLEYEYKRGR